MISFTPAINTEKPFLRKAQSFLLKTTDGFLGPREAAISVALGFGVLSMFRMRAVLPDKFVSTV
jgi:hypothetical protein